MDTTSKRRLDEAGAFVAGCWVTGLALTFYLEHHGKRPITRFCRDNKLAVGLPIAVFTLHVVDVFGPLDPFRGLGRAAAKAVEWLYRTNPSRQRKALA